MLVSLHDVTVGEPDRDLVLTGFDVDAGSVRTGDAEWPMRHGSRPGRDYLDAGSITMTLRTGRRIRTHAHAAEVVSGFMAAWRRDLDLPAGQLTALLIETPAGARVVHGRCGRISPPVADSVLARQGLLEVIAEFRLLDPLAYGVTASSVALSVIPKSIGGIIAPITTPVTTTMTSGIEYRMLTVTGEGPAPLRVIFHGPARDPSVMVGGTEIGVVGEITYDETVVVDGRTRSVHLDDAAQTPAGHRLSRASRLDLLRVPPGTHEVAFTATDRTGTARVTVEATPTYYHL